MILWILIGLMCLAGSLFIAWPLYRGQQRLTPLIAVAVVLLIAGSLGLYSFQGQPGLPSGAGEAPDVEAMVASLAERLEQRPDDIDGWQMLGRSYMTLQDFPRAVEAYERAMALENSQNAQTLVDLGAAILARDNTRIEGRTSALFESALALEPNNPMGLFYGGIAALNRGNTELAAQRWEILLNLNPPDNIKGILEQRIAQWRGSVRSPTPGDEQAGPVVTVSIRLSPEARAALPADASVFVVARDPQQPSPPIAVTRRRLAELPTQVELGDADAMIPGRNLSAYAEFELIARVSVTGEPIGQAGDWYAQYPVTPADSGAVDLVIDRQLP